MAAAACCVSETLGDQKTDTAVLSLSRETSYGAFLGQTSPAGCLRALRLGGEMQWQGLAYWS